MQKVRRVPHAAAAKMLHDKRSSKRFTVVAVATGAAWLMASAPAQASVDHAFSSAGAAKATKVTISAGSPSEFRFKLSKVTVPTGVVTFVVTNKGHLPHDFKIAGKMTKLLQPGKSQTFKITFKKKGAYKFLCTVSGHAAAGMKGTLRVK